MSASVAIIVNQYQQCPNHCATCIGCDRRPTWRGAAGRGGQERSAPRRARAGRLPGRSCSRTEGRWATRLWTSRPRDLAPARAPRLRPRSPGDGLVEIALAATTARGAAHALEADAERPERAARRLRAVAPPPARPWDTSAALVGSPLNQTARASLPRGRRRRRRRGVADVDLAAEARRGARPSTEDLPAGFSNPSRPESATATKCADQPSSSISSSSRPSEFDSTATGTPACRSSITTSIIPRSACARGSSGAAPSRASRPPRRARWPRRRPPRAGGAS